MILESTLGESRQIAAFGIGCDLAIPVIGVKARKPLAQDSQLILVQGSDLLLQLLNAAHSTYVFEDIAHPLSWHICSRFAAN
jgi:hypothetical protein